MATPAPTGGFSTSFSDMSGALTDIFGTSTSGSTSGNSTVSPTNQKFLDAITQILSSNVTDEQYSKASAIKDALFTIPGQIKDTLQQMFPTISSNQKNSGLYNDTTTQQMGNDLQARISTDALTTVLQNIKNYADIQTNSAVAASGAAKTSGTYSSQSQQSGSGGLLGQIGNLFGL